MRNYIFIWPYVYILGCSSLGKVKHKSWCTFEVCYKYFGDLFSLNVLFPQYRSRANTLGNRFIQISSYSHTCLRIISGKTMDQVPLGPILGKQNIQAKESYC